MRFVLDASVALCWCLDRQATPGTDAILRGLAAGDEAEVPFIWPLEIVNVLLNSERRKLLTLADATAFLYRLNEFPIHADTQGVVHCFDQIITTARENRLSAYDASYLELAMRLGLPLATLDRDLNRAAHACGVALIATE
ncbi:MAG: type II toxin-antitoxin system VapC family toxin [Candidatus Binataceae bacterium]